MKKLAPYFLIIAIVSIFSVKLVYAQEQTSTALPIATPAVEATATATASMESTATPTPVVSQEPTPTSTPVEIPGITDNSLYKDLLSKRETIYSLISEENQLCANIKNQEESNNEAVLIILEKSKSYSTPYIKIIDDIKSLLNPIKENNLKNFLTLKETQNSGNGTLKRQVQLSSSHITNLNLAVKAMRESIKYISFESIEYDRKIKTAQQEIDKVNDQLSALNKKIIEDKLAKDLEWESFCAAMYKMDLKSASTSYDNIIKTKERIVNNYKEILNLKINIGELLLPLEY